ncbi:MAG: dynamin family protein [Acidaminococcales bacterium]|jgi:GTPase Era involved in 16S rRNA processing|nr:dynamin family protein [Acidaminococcales bacterium]
MAIFSMTLQDKKRFDAFTEKLDHIAKEIAPGGNREEVRAIEKQKESFAETINDFYNKDRKLNIGIVGQVKAGKSSFLNTLLFDGKEVLPKASTPKTATLTKIEYASENCIQIEYYSHDDWQNFTKLAQSEAEDSYAKAARELLQAAAKNGLSISEKLSSRESVPFVSFEALSAQLNDYVGENGRYTPVVKAVTLSIDKEELKEISIVDTPGLNDPFISRTERTKEFIKLCDVVFFLSQTSSFLDKSDWDLLSTQLPEEGVRKLVLIGSKYDSGILDVLRKQDKNSPFAAKKSFADNIPAAMELVSRNLKKRANEKVAEFTEDLRRRRGEYAKEIIKAIGECHEPLFVSVMAQNMSKKAAPDYDPEERNIFERLSKFSGNMREDLQKLSGMGRVEAVFAGAVREKEDILMGKAKGFVGAATEKLANQLQFFLQKATQKQKILSGNDLEQLQAQQENVKQQINKLKADLSAVFGELSNNIQKEKLNALHDIRAAAGDYFSLSERTGSRDIRHSYKVSASKWYKPWTWWSTKTEYYTTQENYSYLSVSDATGNLRKYAMDSANQLEDVFQEAINFKGLRRKLLNVVVDNLDMGNEKYDSSFLRVIVEEAIGSIELPVFKIDPSAFIGKIGANFSGEITSYAEKEKLKKDLQQVIGDLFDEMANLLEHGAADFSGKMDSIKERLFAKLTEDTAKEFEELVQLSKAKEQEIAKLGGYIKTLEKILSGMER